MEDCAYVGIECVHETSELAQLRHAAAGLAGSAAHPARVLVSPLTRYDLRDEPVAVGEAPFG